MSSDVHVVNVGADWWVECGNGFVVSLGTQVIHVGGSQARVVTAKQIGHHIDEIERVVNLQSLYHFFAVGADSNRDILNRCLASLGSDQHFLKLGGRHIG